jgi:hypothetical protein
VTAVEGRLRSIALPDELEPEVAYGGGVVRGARNAEGAAAVPRRPRRRRVRRGAARRRVRAPAGHVIAGRGFRALLVLALAAVIVFLTLPVLAVFLDAPPGRSSPAWASRARSTRCG